MGKQFDEGTYNTSTGEKKDWTKYTRFAVLNATGENVLFGTKFGGGSGFNRIDQTNMDDSGRIVQGQKLIIRSIFLSYWSTVTKNNADLLSVLNYWAGTVFEFRIANKTIMLQRRLSELFNLSHLLLHVPTAAGDNIGRPTDGQVMKAVVPLNIPIVLAQGVGFDARLQVGIAPGANQTSDFIDVGLQGEQWEVG